MGKADARPCPLICHWELTYRCNLNCIHCFNDKKKINDELKFSEVQEIIDQLKEEGCLHIVFTGGEPFMRGDFMDIYHYAVSKGFMVSIFTNGTLIDDSIIEYVKKMSPFVIEITLHSLDEDVFESITKVKESYAAVSEAIRKVIDANLPLTLKTVGMQKNKTEIYKIKDYVRNLGAKFKFDPHIGVRHNGSKDTCDMRLTPDEVFDMQLGDKEMNGQVTVCLDNQICDNDDYSVFRGCPGGVNSCSINPQGFLQLCLDMPEPAFDLRGGSLKQGFYDFLSGLRNKEYTENSLCRSCELHNVCGHCPAKALLENGNINEPVDCFCQLTHINVANFKKV